MREVMVNHAHNFLGLGMSAGFFIFFVGSFGIIGILLCTLFHKRAYPLVLEAAKDDPNLQEYMKSKNGMRYIWLISARRMLYVALMMGCLVSLVWSPAIAVTVILGYTLGAYLRALIA